MIINAFEHDCKSGRITQTIARKLAWSTVATTPRICLVSSRNRAALQFHDAQEVGERTLAINRHPQQEADEIRDTLMGEMFCFFFPACAGLVEG